MAQALVIAAFAWPMILGGALWARASHAHAPVWAAVIYASASRLCHQRVDRSFFTAGVQWPVCGRCAGLYLGAPLGAVLAVLVRRGGGPPGLRGPEGPGLRARGDRGLHAPEDRRLRATERYSNRTLLFAGAIPSVLTLGMEWFGLAAVSNLTRAVAAAPLGCAIAWALVRVTQPTRADGVH